MSSASEDVLDSGEAGGKAIRGGTFRTGGYVINLVLALVYVPFMVRHLGPVDYGYYITASSIIFVLGGLSEAGLTNIGIREYSVRQGAAREALMRDLVGLRFALTATGVLIAVGFTLVTGAEDEVVLGTAVLGLALFVGLTQQTYMIPLTAQLRLGWVTILEILKQATLTAAILVAVVLGAGLAAFYWASVIAAAVMVVATLALVAATVPLRPSFDLTSWKAILRETLPYAVAAAAGLVYFRVAIVMLSYLSSDEQTGYFSAAFRIVEVVGGASWVVVSSAFPILARAASNDEARLAYALQRLFEISLLLGVGFALGLAVGAPFAIEVVAGDDFGPSVDILRLQSLGLMFSFLLATWTFALLSLKLYRQLLLANLAAIGVAVVLSLILIPPLDAEGAALATAGAEAGLALAAVILLVRARPGLRPNLVVVPKAALAAALAVVPALLLDLPSLVLSLIAGVIFLAALLALRAVPPEIQHALLRRGRSDA